MTPNEWLSQFLCVFLRQREPDERPLYAYKCSDKKYQELQRQVQDHIRDALNNRPPPKFAALFCLYAAETWRRNHAGGAWTWETVFEAVGQTTPQNQIIIHSWVKTGLQYWRRPLLRSRQGHREFLLTIACEGGLPLKLLKQENASLSQYFRELLAEYYHQRHAPHFDISALARQTAALRLPKSLHQDIVYRLSSDLILAVVELQARVPDALDPIAALDKQDEKWRNALPLSLEDDTVKALLGGLIRQAKDLALVAQQRLRWRRRLILQSDGWMLESLLELPAIITGASLQAWTNLGKHPPRLRLLLQNEAGMEAIARLTRTQGEGEAARYRLEVLQKNSIRLTGPEAAKAPTVWLSEEDKETELPVAGGFELGELPWVFVERGVDKEWLAEGSARTKSAQAWVLASSGCSFTVIEGSCEAEETAPQLQRTLYAIQGKVRFDLPTGDTCLVQCGAEADSEEEWLLDGDKLLVALNLRPVFRGTPSLKAVRPDGTRTRIQSNTLEWRAFDATNAAWSKDFTACVGAIWIRALDPETQTVRMRRQIEVLPACARVEVVRVGCNAEPGRIRLSGLQGASISIPQPGCQIEVKSVDGAQEIHCLAGAGLPITQFPLELRWTDGRKLTLTLPFPRQGAAFVRGGEVLGKGQPVVALGRLGAIQAVAQSPGGRSGFWLEATVRVDGDINLYRMLWLREVLQSSGNGRMQFELHRWQERLDSLLAMTRKLDASACLEIHARAGEVVAILEVARFDLEFTTDRLQNRVILTTDALNRLEEGWQNRVIVKMIPLWNPGTEAIVLARDEEEAFATWRVPEDLQAGPWWILGCDGDWARFRPLLWVVHDEEEMSNEEDGISVSPLVQAVCSANEKRPERISKLVEMLAQHPEHADWVQVFEYFKLAQTYPASALDLLTTMAGNPEAMALALIRSSEDQFDSVWSLAHQLPFSWHLLPAQSWRVAIERYYFQTLRTALGDSGADGMMLLEFFNRFRQRAVGRQLFFKSLCDWIHGSVKNDAPSCEKHIRKQEDALQERHSSDEQWCIGPRTLEATDTPDFPEERRYTNLRKPFRPVRCAPFVAAYFNLHNKTCPEDLLFELRQLRDFDRDWFDEVFAIALCLGLAQQPTANPGTSQ